jgi:hypothetical protein
MFVNRALLKPMEPHLNCMEDAQGVREDTDRNNKSPTPPMMFTFSTEQAGP